MRGSITCSTHREGNVQDGGFKGEFLPALGGILNVKQTNTSVPRRNGQVLIRLRGELHGGYHVRGDILQLRLGLFVLLCYGHGGAGKRRLKVVVGHPDSGTQYFDRGLLTYCTQYSIRCYSLRIALFISYTMYKSNRTTRMYFRRKMDSREIKTTQATVKMYLFVVAVRH